MMMKMIKILMILKMRQMTMQRKTRKSMTKPSRKMVKKKRKKKIKRRNFNRLFVNQGNTILLILMQKASRYCAKLHDFY